MGQNLLYYHMTGEITIHLPAIVVWTEGVQGFDPQPYDHTTYKYMYVYYIYNYMTFKLRIYR